MGRPDERFSPYKRRSPLGVFSSKIRNYISSASSAFRGGLRRSLSKVINNNWNGQPNFTTLPVELLHQLFDSITAQELLHICTLSRIHHSQIENYLSSRQFVIRFNRMIATATETAKDSHKLKQSIAEYARLFRMCYLFHSREQCINFIVQLYKKVNQTIHFDKEGHIASFWGLLISKLSNDWSQQEFYTLMQSLVGVADLADRVDRVLRSEDTQWEEELALRLLIRGLFIDHRCQPSLLSVSKSPAPSQQLPFRLSAVLHLLAPDELVNTHRLMLILAAPVNVSIAPGQLNDVNNNEISAGQAFVDYQRIYTEPITDLESARAFLGDLPSMLIELLNTHSTVNIDELRWNSLEMFNFLEMLTTYPEPWVLRNFATLLIMAPGLARVAVQTRAVHGNPEEAGSTLVSCVEASVLLNCQTSVLLRDTIHGLTSKCSPPICMTVMREAIVCTYQHALENMPSSENANQPLDMDSLRTSLEMGRQVADLFLSHLNFIFA